MTKAFTLAEVLITLGIIGIIAAITLPTVIKHHQQQVAVTRLKKFYTNINQAIRLSEAENGSCVTWDMPVNSNEVLPFYNTYLAKYLKTTNVYQSSIDSISKTIVIFPDGSAMAFHIDSNILFSFHVKASDIGKPRNRRSYFLFSFNKVATGSKCTVEPYTLFWNGTREQLKSHSRYGCNETALLQSYCAKLIQYDGWKISKDYPW